MAMDKRSVHRAALVVLLVCVAARAVSAVSDGPLLNGNFEDPPNQSQMSGSLVTGKHAIRYWETSGHVELICSGQKQGDMVLTVPDGAQALRLGSGASIQQQISLTRGQYYSLTFSASRTCAQDETLNITAVHVSGSPPVQSGELPIQTVYTSSGWDSYSWAFKAEAGLVSVIITHNHGDQEEDPGCGPVVDAFAIKTLSQPEATPDNMLRNGDFEEGPYIPGDSPWGVLVPPMDEDDVSPLPGWKIMSYKKSVKYVDAAHFAVPRGARAVELVSGVETALLQEVHATVEGSWYRLAFSVGDAANGCASASSSSSYGGDYSSSSTPGMKVKAYAGQSETTVDVDFGGAGGSKRGQIEFRAAESPTRVVFVSMNYHTKSDNSGTLCGPVVDDVSLVPIPQPYARRLLL